MTSAPSPGTSHYSDRDPRGNMVTCKLIGDCANNNYTYLRDRYTGMTSAPSPGTSHYSDRDPWGNMVRRVVHTGCPDIPHGSYNYNRTEDLSG